MSVDVSRNQFKKSFRRHVNAYRSKPPASSVSHSLLLFYAVECGLKFVIMKSGNIESSRVLEDRGEQWMIRDGHNLVLLASRAGWHWRVGDSVLVSSARGGGRSNHHIKDVHLMWRYGVNVDSTSEQALISHMEELVLWLEEEMA